MENTGRDLMQYTDQKLKAHFQNTSEFNMELVILMEFYRKKLVSQLKDEHKSKVEEELFLCIKSQIFNGYFMGLEVLQNPESSILDEFFTQSEGQITNQAGIMLLTSTGSNPIEIITSDALNKLTSWLVQRYEGIYPLLTDISLNSACMGVKWSLLDEGEIRGLTPHKSKNIGILGALDDITYISPQQYLTAHSVNETTEKWELHNLNLSGSEKVGEVIIFSVYNPEYKQYVVSIYLSNKFSEDELQTITESITMRLMSKNNIERQQIILNVALIESFYQLQAI